MMDKFIKMLQKQGVLNIILEGLRKLGLLTFAFRIYERIKALDLHDMGRQHIQVHPAEGPIPPSDLIVLVAGTPNVGWFLSLEGQCFRSLLIS